MDRVVDFFAPTGRLDAILKFLVFEAMIGPINVLVYHGVLRAPWPTLTKTLLSGFFVSMPFIILALAMLAHLRRLRNQLAELAATDMLTGLPNRRAFIDRICRDSTESLAVDGTLLMIDLDHFKRINDTYGHAVGDACLRAVANHLRTYLMTNEHVARLGGEEFGIFTARGQDRASELVDWLASGVRIDGVPALNLHVTMSIGMTRTVAGVGLLTALSQADEALYAAKASGRARGVVWTENMNLPAIAHST